MGNRRFRSIISESIEVYNSASTRAEKYVIVENIIAIVNNSGGRFLKMGKDGEWSDLDAANTRQKIAHAIRDATAKMEAKLKRDVNLSKRDSLATSQVPPPAQVGAPSAPQGHATAAVSSSKEAKKKEAGTLKTNPTYKVTMHPPIDFSKRKTAPSGIPPHQLNPYKVYPQPPSFSQTPLQASNVAPTPMIHAESPMDLYHQRGRLVHSSAQLPTAGLSPLNLATSTVPFQPMGPHAASLMHSSNISVGGVAGHHFRTVNEVTPDGGMIASTHFPSMQKTPSPHLGDTTRSNLHQDQALDPPPDYHAEVALEGNNPMGKHDDDDEDSSSVVAHDDEFLSKINETLGAWQPEAAD